jgi:hypothetical protein
MFDWLLATFRSYLDRCPPVTGNPLRRWQRQLPGFQSRRGHSDPDCAVVTAPGWHYNFTKRDVDPLPDGSIRRRLWCRSTICLQHCVRWFAAGPIRGDQLRLRHRRLSPSFPGLDGIGE